MSFLNNLLSSLRVNTPPTDILVPRPCIDDSSSLSPVSTSHLGSAISGTLGPESQAELLGRLHSLQIKYNFIFMQLSQEFAAPSHLDATQKALGEVSTAIVDFKALYPKALPKGNLDDHTLGNDTCKGEEPTIIKEQKSWMHQNFNPQEVSEFQLASAVNKTEELSCKQLQYLVYSSCYKKAYKFMSMAKGAGYEVDVEKMNGFHIRSKQLDAARRQVCVSLNDLKKDNPQAHKTYYNGLDDESLEGQLQKALLTENPNHYSFEGIEAIETLSSKIEAMTSKIERDPKGDRFIAALFNGIDTLTEMHREKKLEGESHDQKIVDFEEKHPEVAAAYAVNQTIKVNFELNGKHLSLDLNDHPLTDATFKRLKSKKIEYERMLHNNHLLIEYTDDNKLYQISGHVYNVIVRIKAALAAVDNALFGHLDKLQKHSEIELFISSLTSIEEAKTTLLENLGLVATDHHKALDGIGMLYNFTDGISKANYPTVLDENTPSELLDAMEELEVLYKDRDNKKLLYIFNVSTNGNDATTTDAYNALRQVSNKIDRIEKLEPDIKAAYDRIHNRPRDEED